MSSDVSQGPALFGIGAALLIITGFYIIVGTRNMIRTVIGLVLLTKACTLLFAVAGSMTGQLALAQGLIITAIILEVAIVVVAMGIILHLYRRNQSLDTRLLRNLKG